MQTIDEPIIPSYISRLPEEVEGMSREQDAHNKRTYRLSVIAIVVSAFLGAGNLTYQAIRDHFNNASSGVRFGKIETALRLLTGTVAPQLQKAVDDSLANALLDQIKAPAQMDYAKTVIHQLREAKVSLPNNGIQQTTQYVEDLVQARAGAPQTWSMAAEFISYRSEVLKKWGDSNLPACDEAVGKGFVSAKGSHQITHGPMVFSYCKIILDSPEATISLSTNLSFADVVFEHCAVFYNGGSIVLFPVKVATDSPAKLLGSVSFNDCLFTFSLSTAPPPDGQKLTRALLAASSNNVEVQFEANPS
jgi:hypothetical protein